MRNREAHTSPSGHSGCQPVRQLLVGAPGTHGENRREKKRRLGWGGSGCALSEALTTKACEGGDEHGGGKGMD